MSLFAKRPQELTFGSLGPVCPLQPHYTKSHFTFLVMASLSYGIISALVGALPPPTASETSLILPSPPRLPQLNHEPPVLIFQLLCTEPAGRPCVNQKG